MKNRIKGLIRKVHHSLPPGIRNSYRFLIDFVKKLGHYYMPVHHHICKDRESGTSFIYMHIGWDRKLRHYWLNRLADEHELKAGSKKIASWRIPGYLNKVREGVDLAIIESNNNAIPALFPHCFLLPRWMEMVFDIETALKKSRIRNITRNIRKHSLEYEIRSGLEAFDLFYHTMYHPFVQKRYGESAEIADYKHYAGKYRKEGGDLFFIMRDGEPVAGILMEVKKGEYRLSSAGILEGDDEIYGMGVIGALYYFIMRHYLDQGIRTLRFGSSMPVVFDGVTTFKMQLGAKPYLKDLVSRDKYYFLPLNDSPSVQRVLKENPLFHLTGPALDMAAFIMAEEFSDREDFFRYFKRVKYQNGKQTRIYCFDDPENITGWLNEAGLDHIKCIRYGK